MSRLQTQLIDPETARMMVPGKPKHMHDIILATLQSGTFENVQTDADLDAVKFAVRGLIEYMQVWLGELDVK